MHQTSKTSSRKKFLFTGASLLSFFALWKFLPGKKNKKEETVKMLTHDGKLVEVNSKLMASKKRKVSDEELKNWISK